MRIRGKNQTHVSIISAPVYIRALKPTCVPKIILVLEATNALSGYFCFVTSVYTLIKHD